MHVIYRNKIYINKYIWGYIKLLTVHCLKGFCFEGQKTEEAAGRPITEELFLPGKP